MERHGRDAGYGGGGGWESEYGWNAGNTHDPYYYDQHYRNNTYDAQQYLENQQRHIIHNRRYQNHGRRPMKRREENSRSPDKRRRENNRNGGGGGGGGSSRSGETRPRRMVRDGKKARWSSMDSLDNWSARSANMAPMSMSMSPLADQADPEEERDRDPKLFEYKEWEAFGRAERLDHVQAFLRKSAETQAALEREGRIHRGDAQENCFHEQVLKIAPEAKCVADDPEQLELFPERLFPDEPEKIMLTHFPSCVQCKRISHERYPFYIGGPTEKDGKGNGGRGGKMEKEDKDAAAAAAGEGDGGSDVTAQTQGLEPRDPRLGGEKFVKFPKYLYVPGPFRSKEAEEKEKEEKEKASTTASPGSNTGSPKRGSSGAETNLEEDEGTISKAPKGTPWTIEAMDMEEGDWYFPNERHTQVGPKSMEALRDMACKGEVPWGLSLHRSVDGTDTILKPYALDKRMSQLPSTSNPQPTPRGESKRDQWLNEAYLREKEEYIRGQEMAPDASLCPIQPHSHLRKRIHRKVLESALTDEIFKDCVKSILKKKKRKKGLVK